jgi:hypothetical protein
MPDDNPQPGPREPHVTAEVGSEGGSPGDLELDVDEPAATGSEAGETSRPTRQDLKEIVRDETGEGRRSS